MPTILGNIVLGTRPPKPTYDASKDPNQVVLAKHGARRSTVRAISAPFYERNISEIENIPKWERCSQETPGSYARIRISVTFDNVLNKINKPLELSVAETVAYGDKANFAKFIAAVLGINVKDVAALAKQKKLDLELLVGKPVMSITYANKYGTASLKAFNPMAIDLDEPSAAAGPGSAQTTSTSERRTVSAKMFVDDDVPGSLVA